MQSFPTVQQIQRVLPFSPVVQNETTNANGEAYGLPIITGGELAPVLRTLVLCDEKMRYYVCAVLKEHSWEPKYNSAGCKEQTILGWDVTIARRSSKLGNTLLQIEFGQNITLFGLNMLVVNVGGGPVRYCKDFAELHRFVEYQREAPTRDEHKKLFMQRLTQRGYRLRCDTSSLKEFTQLNEYAEVLNQEIKAQRYFEDKQPSSVRHLKEILRLEQELLIATEREMQRLQDFRDKATRLGDEANQRRAELRRQEEQQREDEKQRRFELEQVERKLQQEYVEEQKRQKQLQLLQDLEEAQRLEQEQIVRQEADGRQKQEALDKHAAQYSRSTEPLAYEKAIIQFQEIQHYIGESASSHIIREWASILRSRCIKSQDAVPSTSVQAPASDGVGTKIGAIMGGIFGIMGGPVGMAIGAAAGGLIGNLADHASDSSSTSQNPTERKQWTTLISNIDELISKLSTKDAAFDSDHNNKAKRLPATCRWEGCSHPRIYLSVFCKMHHEPGNHLMP